MGERRSQDWFPWVESSIECLKSLLLAKITYEQIAITLSAEFGGKLTRQAIAGKVKRLGIQGMGNPPFVKMPLDPAKVKVSRPKKRKLQSRTPVARSLVAPGTSSTAKETVLSLPQPAQTGEAGDRSVSPDHLPPPSLPVVFRRPVGILEAQGCRATVGVDAEVIGRWLFCDQTQVEGSSYCHHHHPLLSAPPVRLPGAPSDNHVRRREADASEQVKPLDEMMGIR